MTEIIPHGKIASIVHKASLRKDITNWIVDLENSQSPIFRLQIFSIHTFTGCKISTCFVINGYVQQGKHIFSRQARISFKKRKHRSDRKESWWMNICKIKQWNLKESWWSKIAIEWFVWLWICYSNNFSWAWPWKQKTWFYSHA